jgi:hypothetical protein
MISSKNALKHGQRSKTLAALRNDSTAFEIRLQKWLVAEDPRDDTEEFLVAHKVGQSFDLERAKESHLDRLSNRLENAAEIELKEIHAVGDRLFHDPAGHQSVYGNVPLNNSKLKRTSGNGELPDPNNPRDLVWDLEATEMGCQYLLFIWEDLKALLDAGHYWESAERLKCTRLLGRQPLDAMTDERVAQIFVGSRALDPHVRRKPAPAPDPAAEAAVAAAVAAAQAVLTGKRKRGDNIVDYQLLNPRRLLGPFRDLLSDLTMSQYDHLRKHIWRRFPDLWSVRDPAVAKATLLELCEWHMEDLTAKMAAHHENADAKFQERFNRIKADQTAEGEKLRSDVLKYTKAYFKTEDALRKAQAREKPNTKIPRGDEGEPRRIPEHRRQTSEAQWKIDREILAAADTSWALDPAASSEPPVAEKHAEPAGSKAGENQKTTNEPNSREPVLTIETERTVEVTANPAHAALDKMTKQPASLPAQGRPGLSIERGPTQSHEGDPPPTNRPASRPTGPPNTRR